MTTCNCGATLTRTSTPADEWRWVDDEGRGWVPPTADNNPYDRMEAMLADGSNEAMAAYSALSARVTLHYEPYGHHHRPVDEQPFVGPVPWCCGEPMWLRPSGWHCRVGCGGAP